MAQAGAGHAVWQIATTASLPASHFLALTLLATPRAVRTSAGALSYLSYSGGKRSRAFQALAVVRCLFD